MVSVEAVTFRNIDILASPILGRQKGVKNGPFRKETQSRRPGAAKPAISPLFVKDACRRVVRILPRLSPLFDNITIIYFCAVSR